MAHIITDHLSLFRGDRALFSDVSFRIERGERVGLIGPNGAGKSTLLAEGAPEPDAGRVRVDERGGVYRMAQEQETADPRSGGERTRAALDQALASGAALLLLDEPTNHLDLDGVHRLIAELSAFEGTLLIVSHDRYLLDNAVQRILELENGKITEYSGGYSDYRDQKARDFDDRLHRWQQGVKRQRALQQDIDALRARAEKAHRLSTEKPSSGLKMGEKEKSAPAPRRWTKRSSPT